MKSNSDHTINIGEKPSSPQMARLTLNSNLMFKNLRDWRTTLPTIIGIIMTLVGSIFPQWFTDVPVEEITGATLNVFNGIGVIILWVTGLLSRGGTE